MSISCLKCKKPAVTFIRYNGTHLCEKHFIEYFEKRVKKEIKKQGKTKDNSKIGVAVSGGKDSIVTLHLINNLFSKRPNPEVHAITVDEGIKGYRDESIKAVKKNCNLLNIPLHIVSFKETIGKTMDEIALKKDELGECTYCGVFRRFCLNIKTKELKINKLVTGHNLDDMSQSILMNFANGDLQKLARLGPHKKIQPGLTPRMIPLRTIPEKEIMLYAILREIEFHNAECFYSYRASRGFFREIIEKLELNNPGTRHSILNSYDGINDLLLNKFPPASLNSCSECGEPTSQDLCKTCILKKRI